MNYFCFVDNRKSMGSIIHGLKMSCALTLALKYKLRTAAKAFGTYGSELTCPKTKTKLFIPDTFARLLHSNKFGVVPEGKEGSPPRLLQDSGADYSALLFQPTH
jgi:hypothetical protein